MASVKNVAVFFLIIMALCGASFGDVYHVGDSAGWTSMGLVDYDHWALDKNFHIGDALVFEYNNQFHNLNQVTYEDFTSCNATSPIALYNSAFDSITLNRLGHFYFICGFPGHCNAGQKVDIKVTGASPSPLGSPAPSPAQNSASSLYSSKLWMALPVLVFLVTGFAC